MDLGDERAQLRRDRVQGYSLDQAGLLFAEGRKHPPLREAMANNGGAFRIDAVAGNTNLAMSNPIVMT